MSIIRLKDLSTIVYHLTIHVTPLSSSNDVADNALARNSDVGSRIKNLLEPPGVSPLLDLVFQTKENLTTKISVRTTMSLER